MGLRRVLLYLCAVVMAGCVLHAQDRWEYDSQVVYFGLQDTLKWWANGHHGRPPIFGGFPVFQYLTGLPTVALSRIGVGVETYGLWIHLNQASLAGTCLLLAWAGHRRGARTAGLLAAATLLAGPLVYYAASTFNELTAVFLTTAFTAACCARWPRPVQAVLFILAGLTKETAPPLLVLLWLGANLSDPPPRWRRDIVWMVVATTVTFAIHGAFNVFRFGTPLNLHYLQADEIVKPWAWRTQYAAAIWLSPNGGILWFCPAMVGLVALAVPRFRREGRAAAWCAAAVLLGVTCLLSAWWSPFGWWCWGPRLALPWLPPILLLLLWTQPEAFARTAEILTRTPSRQAALALLLVALALPHTLLLANSAPVIQFFEAPEPAWSTDPILKQHQLVLFEAWHKTPWMLAGPFRMAWSLGDLAVPLIFLASLAGFVLTFGGRERRDMP